MNRTKKSLIITLCLLGVVNISAQNQQESKKNSDSLAIIQTKTAEASKESSVKVNFYGFIRHDAFYDTRQNIGAGENIVPLYPRDRALDINGVDINDAPKFHMLSVVSRAGINVKGPEVLGAKTNGILEGEFFGSTEAGINEFRLRHAYVTLDWKTTQLGVGQYWHPMVILDCLPNVVNYSTGSPIFALNRNPQIRLTQKLNENFKIIAAINSQRDFTPNTTPYRDSGLPSSHLQIQYKSKSFVAGLAGQYEILRPQLSSGNPPIVNKETVKSFTALAYTRVITKPLMVSASVMMAQNAASLVMLGGFVGYSAPGTYDLYRTMNTRSAWIDFQQTTDKKIAFGLYAGIVKNMGANNPVEDRVSTSYGVTTSWGAVSATKGARSVDQLWRLVPRVDWSLSKTIKLRFEVENTVARWGDAQNNGRGIGNDFNATNNRFHLATFFMF
ncbi:DcaP family trimeric outer membrane transporter [Chryseobacterium oryzae]|uniref:DcaP family trimeric outer membrane transporter n=1 Tax=Chryseobacterium oryzae TaxID=2929799 RepID=A0ABY4BDX3_9FLAO|nr:DcaP family trimeric outer membrane transporter [Chryseobacterium oryzae]UOE36944.1 DcaP family trimeric outer membrane transporter [Chryseobacterium oryzae]